jgi:predicted thioesterase
MAFREPALNISGTATANVTTSALASSMTLSSGDVSPEVFSTVGMLALMDGACAQVLRPYLVPLDTSVSVRVDITPISANTSRCCGESNGTASGARY